MVKSRLILSNLFFILVVLAASLSAQIPEGAFAVIEPNARAATLGGVTALSGSVLDLASNPAGLAKLSQTELGFMFTDLYGIGIDYYYLGIAVPLRRGFVGLSAGELSNDIDILYKERYTICSFGMGLTKSLSFGTNLKLFNVTSAEPATGRGLDLGFQYKPQNSKVGFGFVAKNVFGELDYGTYKEPATDYYQTGVAIELNSSLVTIDVNNYQQVMLGYEYKLTPSCTLRVGVRDNKLNFGLGLNKSKLKIDYTYSNAHVGASHLFNTVLSF